MGGTGTVYDEKYKKDILEFKLGEEDLLSPMVKTMKKGEKACFRNFSKKETVDKMPVFITYKITLRSYLTPKEAEELKAKAVVLATASKEEGVSLFKAGNLKEAAAKFKEAFNALQPHICDDLAHLACSSAMNLANCYNKLSEFDKTIELMTSTLEFAEHPKCFYHRGVSP